MEGSGGREGTPSVSASFGRAAPRGDRRARRVRPPQLPGPCAPSLCLYGIHRFLHLDASTFTWMCVFVCKYVKSCVLIVRSDVNLLGARLFSRQSPPVYVMRSFLLLLRLGALLLQLLTLELRSPVLKPDFYLRGRGGGY